MATYYPGQLIKMAVTITVDGTDTDPSTIALVVTDPYGTRTSYTPTHDGTGLYHYDFDTTSKATGAWWYQFSGTGAAQGAATTWFYILPAAA